MKKSSVQSSREDKLKVIIVLVHLSEGSAIKFVSHNGYDKLLCNHVYLQFCPNCPQYQCKRRKVWH